MRPQFGIMTPIYPASFFFANGRFKGKEKGGRWFASPKLRGLLPVEERGDLRLYLWLCNRIGAGD